MPKLLTVWGYADSPSKNLEFIPAPNGLIALAADLFTVGPSTDGATSVTGEQYKEYAVLDRCSDLSDLHCSMTLAGVLYANAKDYKFFYWRIKPEYSEWDNNDNFDSLAPRTKSIDMWCKVYMRCLFSNIDWRTLDGRVQS